MVFSLVDCVTGIFNDFFNGKLKMMSCHRLGKTFGVNNDMNKMLLSTEKVLLLKENGVCTWRR